MRQILFSPGQDIRSAAVAFVAAVKTEILVNCYGLSDPRIVDALLERRGAGCRVSILVDQTQASGPADQAQLPRLTAAGIEVLTTSSPTGAIDHEKVMIADGNLAWWGSYNFSESAQSQRNYAEQDDSAIIVVAFLADWHDSHDWAVAHPEVATPHAYSLESQPDPEQDR